MSLIYQFTWRNIQVKVKLTPDEFPSYREIYGVRMNHIEILCEEPLPMTETGYKSHFIQEDVLAEAGGAVSYVTEWLEQEADSKEWKKQEISRQQLSFF